MRNIPSIRSLGFALVLLSISAAAYAQVGISVTFAPPELPVYEQPPIPGGGYIWTPGYWAWSDGDGDYYWVPGTLFFLRLQWASLFPSSKRIPGACLFDYGDSLSRR